MPLLHEEGALFAHAFTKIQLDQNEYIIPSNLFGEVFVTLATTFFYFDNFESLTFSTTDASEVILIGSVVFSLLLS